MTDEPASPANDFCPFGEGLAPGAGCIKEAWHDGDHMVVSGGPDGESRPVAYPNPDLSWPQVRGA
jgi:hypothetical protein